jgi:serine/threonine-protein kinase
VTDRLSPGKILVGEDNNTKVDFFRAPMARRITLAEISYVAPEALKTGGLRTGAGRPEDRAAAAKSGVYTLGAILYHMLAGIPPFEGETPEVVLPRIVKETPPPLRRVNLKVSPALARVVERAMDKDPENRPPDFRSFEADLKKIIAPVL